MPDFVTNLVIVGRLCDKDRRSSWSEVVKPYHYHSSKKILQRNPSILEHWSRFTFSKLVGLFHCLTNDNSHDIW